MELHTLKIRNIASIGHADIDFTAPPLEGEPIFLICGETGAGKSTILDAICLALYNDAPRLASAKTEKILDDAIPPDKRTGSESITIGDTRQFLRKGTAEGSVTLTFSGNDGLEYKAVWSTGRSRGKADAKLKEVSWTLEWEDNFLSSKKEVKARIEMAAGMNFHQYCRTAMLAQGEFSKFLKSPENEKADILEKLTRTDIYARIGMKVACRMKEEKEKFLLQQQKARGITKLSEEGKRELLERRAELDSGLEKAREEKKAADIRLQYLDRAASLGKSLEEAAAEKEKASAQVNSVEFVETVKLCREWDSTADQRAMVRNLGELYKNRTGILEEKERNAEDYRILSAVTESERRETARMSASSGILRKRLEEDSPNEEMYMSVKSITSFLMQALSYSSEKKKREAVLEKTKAATAMYGQLVKEEEGHLSRLQETKAELQKRHEAAAKALMEKDKDGIMEGKVKLEKEKNSITEAGTAVRALSNEISRQKTEQEALENIRKQYLDAGARLQEKKELAEKAEKEFADARELYEKMKESADDWARIARSRLRVGDICPVCGQKVMSVMSDAEFDTLLKPVSDRYSGAENRFREAVRGLDEAKVMFKTLEDRLSEASRRASEAVKIMEEYRKSAGEKCAALELDPGQEGILENLVGMWRDCERREKETEALLKDISVLEEQDRQTVRQISELDTEIRATSENLEKQKSVKELSERTAVRLASEAESLGNAASDTVEQAGKLISVEGWREKFSENPEKFMSDTENAAASYIEDRKRLEKLDDDIRKYSGTLTRVGTVMGRFHYGENALSPYTGKLPDMSPEDLEDSWNRLLVRTNLTEEKLETTEKDIRSKEEILAEFHSGSDIGKERLEFLCSIRAEEIERKKEDTDRMMKTLSAAESLFEQRRQDLAALRENAPQFGEEDTRETLTASSMKLEESMNVLNREIGAINQTLEQDEENALKAAAEQEKTDEQEKEYRKWEALSDIFGDNEGRKFRKIAQSFILSDLIRNANTYLSRLSDRYVLDNQNGSLTITVRDLFQGGAERSVNTLSGGETFLVSLSLALGLSSLSRSAMQVSTLFIDEGFGTLSSDYLNVVMETLENLHQIGGKKVGIISHVESLRERIPTKILVTRQGNSASRVEVMTE